jgi:hypothetical protein
MTTQREESGGHGVAAAGVGVGGALAFAYGAAATVLLALLLWKYVPHRAAALADSGAELSLSERLVTAASLWFVRLLPLLVLAAIPASVVAFLLGLWLVATRPRALRALLVAYALAVTAAGVLVVLAI